jgi:DNA-binding NtrC family response regulator
VDVRVITATNRRLMERVAAGEFREDLFYRLNVIHIEIPPLRRRRDDVPALLAYFLRHFSQLHQIEVPAISEDAAAQISAAEWPGNVRQLRNVVERLVVRSHGRIITNDDLPREILTMGAPTDEIGTPRRRADVIFERMVRDGETFWNAVYEPFMSRDITRDDVRSLVRQGLELTRGSYKAVARLFNVPESDYKRLLNFLRKYQCHLPIQAFRAIPIRVANREEQPSQEKAV